MAPDASNPLVDSITENPTDDALAEALLEVASRSNLLNLQKVERGGWRGWQPRREDNPGDARNRQALIRTLVTEGLAGLQGEKASELKKTIFQNHQTDCDAIFGNHWTLDDLSTARKEEGKGFAGITIPSGLYDLLTILPLETADLLRRALMEEILITGNFKASQAPDPSLTPEDDPGQPQISCSGPIPETLMPHLINALKASMGVDDAMTNELTASLRRLAAHSLATNWNDELAGALALSTTGLEDERHTSLRMALAQMITERGTALKRRLIEIDREIEGLPNDDANAPTMDIVKGLAALMTDEVPQPSGTEAMEDPEEKGQALLRESRQLAEQLIALSTVEMQLLESLAGNTNTKAAYLRTSYLQQAARLWSAQPFISGQATTGLLMGMGTEDRLTRIALVDPSTGRNHGIRETFDATCTYAQQIQWMRIIQGLCKGLMGVPLTEDLGIRTYLSQQGIPALKDETDQMYLEGHLIGSLAGDQTPEAGTIRDNLLRKLETLTPSWGSAQLADGLATSLGGLLDTNAAEMRGKKLTPGWDEESNPKTTTASMEAMVRSINTPVLAVLRAKKEK